MSPSRPASALLALLIALISAAPALAVCSIAHTPRANLERLDTAVLGRGRMLIGLVSRMACVWAKLPNDHVMADAQPCTTSKIEAVAAP